MKRTFGPHSARELARAEGQLQEINALEPAIAGETDEALQARAAALRRRAGEGEPLDALLVECFAVTREAAHRTLGMRPFDVQILGGIALHRGNVAEMRTGEGKTLTAVLPVTLNALAGRGVHVVTVNDYLATRDAEWMGPVYRYLGLQVGCVTEALDPETRRRDRRAAYAAEVTYVTNHELVFDYLRDNLALDPEEVVLRDHHFALVDEVDFLLLDEARTPLIISGEAGDELSLAAEARRIVRPLEEGKHYRVAHKTKQVSVLEAGWRRMERALGVENLADAEHIGWQHALHNALLAHGVFQRDVDYITQGGQVFIVDEFTGRVSRDKRFADGLHQALEAKEGVEIRPEDETLAKISYQTYFRLYPKLAGMTGTAATEKEELMRTYNLGVVVIPTNRPMVRQDFRPIVYRTAAEKFTAVIDEIEEQVEQGRPVLVGTTSVEESETVSRRLEKRDIPHAVLNAKNHEREAEIIAEAGYRGRVTVSTNMAGRGTDIKLGEGVAAAGGLAVIGTGLHEAERIDNQLRGRAGRQGDPGTSIYYLSVEDPVYKKFGRYALPELAERLADHPKNEPIRDRAVLRRLDELRQKVEEENRAIRKEVLKYDAVIEIQRKTIYRWRAQLLGTPLRKAAKFQAELIAQIGDDLVARHLADSDDLPLHERFEALVFEFEERFGIPFAAEELGDEADWSADRARQLVEAKLSGRIAELDEAAGRNMRIEFGRAVLLATIDELWTEHLGVLERLDEGIGLRGYAELDPLVEFQKEGGALFEELLRDIRLISVSRICRPGAFDGDGDLDVADALEEDNPFVPGKRRRTLKR